MSSINSHTTYNYSQPSEYRFSHDSVFLARRVFEFLCESDIQTFKALDLCSGCGIIGLDFIFHCLNELGQSPLSFDFMEVQSIYETHFFDNINGLKKSENLKNKEALKTEIKFNSLFHVRLIEIHDKLCHFFCVNKGKRIMFPGGFITSFLIAHDDQF
jgi:hypothetical protein